ncbi:MAG: PKD domain-containing protein [Mucilaginibacter sp.]
MQSRTTKILFFLVFFAVFATSSGIAQTISIGTIDPGPYGPGSTIAVPFHVDDSGGCISLNNTFALYMSDALGNFTSTTPVATVSGFYATYINYTIPAAGLPPGSGYKFTIKSTSPAVPSFPSSAITITASAGIAAAIATSAINSTYSTPENIVFGQCSGPQPSYLFTNETTGASSVTASFFNESTQAFVVSGQNITSAYTFSSANTNYTVIVKAVNAAGIVGTRAYQLINNQVSTTIGFTGNPSVCVSGGVAPLTYNIDYTSATGIQNNYPGNSYTFSWGDGSAPTVLSLCQIKALKGLVSHNYTKPSCGNIVNGQVNAFEVDFSASNAYCGKIGSLQTSYAKIVISPTNYIAGPSGTGPPTTACTGTPITFYNGSITGPDPNATTASCADDPNALFVWMVDNVVIKQNYKLGQSFTYTFATNGTHTVTLHAQNTNGICQAVDQTISICVQNPPQPSFTLPASPFCTSSNPLIPTNTSIVDAGCTPTQYKWTVSPSTFTYAGGTNANSQQPQYNFTAPGTYTIQLDITTTSCGTVSTLKQTIVVTSPPVATLSNNFSICGNNQTLTFDNTAGSATQTTLTGTTSPSPTTYSWTVTGGTYQFVNGTTASSRYPQILFSDFATYTVTVTHQNSCGTVTSVPQQITFLQAPNVNAGVDQQICQGNTVHLVGNISGVYNNSQWVGGSGTFSSPNATTTDYTPSASDIANGSVTFTLIASTSLPAPCDKVISRVTVTIIPTDVVTSAATQSICSGQPVNYTITASNAGSTFTWTAVLTSGAATGFSTSGSGSIISDVITNGNLANPAVITYTITPQSNGCTGTPFTFTVTIPGVPTVTPTAVNAAICSSQPANITLASSLPGTTYTWTASAPAGITGFNNVSNPTANTSIQDVLVNTSTAIATVTYIVTPYSTNGCAGTPVNVSVKVYPVPVVANAGNNISLCNLNAYTLQGNSPGTGTGLWTVVSGTGLTFADNTNPTTSISGLQPGSVYQLQWTITTGPGCQSSSTVTITVNVPTVPGTTTAVNPAAVCAGSNSGQINLTGYTGNILRWESSVDNGLNWQPIANTNASQTYLNLTQTTLYRGVVQNGACTVEFSGTTTITVNPNAPVANAGNAQTLCGATTTILSGNDPGTFKAVWHQTAGPPVTFVDSTLYNTAVTGLLQGNSYTFVWTIQALSPCPNTQSQVTIIDNADVVPTFTTSIKTGCGNLPVQFTNTSNNQVGANFVWNFGDGSALSHAVSPQHIFTQRTDGRDTVYYITLSVSGNCLQRPPAIDSVLVRPATPIARILPAVLSGCGNFALTVQNISPGNNLTYDFYLYDGVTLLQKITKTDKTDAVFNAITTTSRKSYTLYMIATGFCNNTDETTHIPITISPAKVTAQMFVQNNINSGCAPLNLIFYNNSAGGDNFHYNIYNAKNQLIDQPLGGLEPLPYLLDSVGTFYVSITASNACGVNESPKIRLDVYAVPSPDFVADNTGGCKTIVVNFTNKTKSNDPVTAATSLVYDWDFGDGSTHSTAFTPPPHAYRFANSPYTITLTATNTTSGCSNVMIKKSYIVVTGPPVTQFTAKPDTVTAIPNYSFTFTDETKGSPVSWKWVFSDGQTSTKQNPFITFADTGIYKVTLTTADASGCDSTISHKVQITGVPGQLFLPNAFIPSSLTQDLKVFMAKGSGIKSWHLQIFNTYGQLVWETTKLDGKGAPIDGWDGTFKGIPAPQGVYIWQATASFINGTEWKGNSYGNSLPKRTGSVHLIR